MDKTQEYDEKDTKLNTDQPPLFIPFFLDFVPQYFLFPPIVFLQHHGLCSRKCRLTEYGFPLCSRLVRRGRCVDPCCKSCSSCFPMCPRRFSRKRVRGEALLLVVSLAAALDLHGPRRGNILAKRCYLL